MMPDLIIDDSTSSDVTHPSGVGFGLVPRDYNVDPVEMFAAPTTIPLIPRSEWDARIDEQERLQSSLEHIRLTANGGQPIPSLDQNKGDGVHWGYCWAHSTTHTVMLHRAVANLPYVPLSAFAVACIIKNYANDGGWCGLSAKFARERGIPSQKFWPQKNLDRANDNPETWADAAKHKITEDYVDLTRDVWGQNMTFDQVATCLLSNIPCALDFNWWGHSVCGIRLVRVEAGSYGIKIWNSWADSWGDRGMGILRGSKAVPNGAVATRTTTISGV